MFVFWPSASNFAFEPNGKVNSRKILVDVVDCHVSQAPGQQGKDAAWDNCFKMMKRLAEQYADGTITQLQLKPKKKEMLQELMKKHSQEKAKGKVTKAGVLKRPAGKRLALQGSKPRASKVAKKPAVADAPPGGLDAAGKGEQKGQENQPGQGGEEEKEVEEEEREEEPKDSEDPGALGLASHAVKHMQRCMSFAVGKLCVCC